MTCTVHIKIKSFDLATDDFQLKTSIFTESVCKQDRFALTILPTELNALSVGYANIS